MLNKHIHIHLSSAACHDAITVGMLHGVITQQTEKAYGIQLDGAKATLWIPIKALQRAKLHPAATGGQPCDIFTLARWFRPDRHQQQIMAAGTSYGHIST